MSVAFTKESDSEAVAADLPDRPISPNRNFVTPSGLAALDEALAAARAAYNAAQASEGITADRTAMARATRDLRYYSARRASAELVPEPPADGTAGFGSTVELLREDGRTQIFRIVGEDEADPATGSISYVSPLARALIGRSAGDVARFGTQEIELLEVRP